MEGIKKLLSASTAGLPNWAWLLIIGGGIGAAIFVPKLFPNLFGGGTSTDTTGTSDTGTPSVGATDQSGYYPFQGGYGGGGGTTSDGTVTTPTTTTTTPTDTTVPPTVPFPPVQPSAPSPPPATTGTTDTCKQRQQCIDYHVQHTCGGPTATVNKQYGSKTKCIEHWTSKCNGEHPCGHSMVPALYTTMDIWPYNRQQRRNVAYMVNGKPTRLEELNTEVYTPRVDLPPIEEGKEEI